MYKMNCGVSSGARGDFMLAHLQLSSGLQVAGSHWYQGTKGRSETASTGPDMWVERGKCRKGFERWRRRACRRQPSVQGGCARHNGNQCCSERHGMLEGLQLGGLGGRWLGGGNKPAAAPSTNVQATRASESFMAAGPRRLGACNRAGSDTRLQMERAARACSAKQAEALHVQQMHSYSPLGHRMATPITFAVVRRGAH